MQQATNMNKPESLNNKSKLKKSQIPAFVTESNGSDSDPQNKINVISQRFRSLKNLFKNGRAESLRENLENELSREVGDGNAMFSPEERTLLRNTLKFRETRVEDVMVPRADIKAVEQDCTLGQLIGIFHQSGHSRMPVFSNNLDDPKGMIHIKDLITHIFESESKSVSNDEDSNELPIYHQNMTKLNKSILSEQLIRPVLFVPPSMRASELLSKMQASRIQLALVIDEYGGTDGLVSLEDIVEIVVGDIEDEHDEDQEPKIESQNSNVWSADARVNIEDARQVIGEDFGTDAQWEETDTLGGIVFTIAGRVPVRGEVLSSKLLPGYEFLVTEADQRRIKHMKIARGGFGHRKVDPTRSRRIVT